MDNGDGALEDISYDDFKKLYNKWHAILGQTFLGCLESKEYIHTRAGLILLSRIVNVFPTRPVLGEKIMDELNSEVGQHPNVAEIRGKGLLIGIEVVKEKEGLICFDENEKITSQIMMKGLEDGVFLYPGGTGEFRDIICLGPAFTIGDEEIELMVKAVKNSLEFIANKYS